MKHTTTTLKVSQSTYETFSRAAREAQMSDDEYLTYLLVEQMWSNRMKSVRSSMAAPDDDYRAEVRLWDTTSSDGLEDL